MTTRDSADHDLLPAGRLELVHGEALLEMSELVERMSGTRRSSRQLDRIAARMTDLLVPDAVVDELLRGDA